MVADPDAVAAGLDRADRIVGAQDALGDQRNRADRAQPGELVPVHGRKHHDARVRIDRLVGWQVHAKVDPEVVAPIALTVAWQRQVDGERHGRVARVGGTLDERTRRLPIGRVVQLEPARGAGGGSRDLLHRSRRDRRQRHERAGGRGSPGGRNLAVRVGEVVRRRWRNDDRVAQRRTERAGADVDLRDVDEDVWPEPEPVPRVAVVGEGQLVAGASGVVVPCARLHPRPGKRLELGHVDRSVIAHAGDDATRNTPQ